jgi:hypothetical protein
MAIDYTVPLGQVRLLIADTDPASMILEDPQVEGFLAINAGSVRRAAADALDAIADSEVLVSKVIKTQDLSTDGAKTADALRVHADRLRDQAEDDDFCFEIVNFDPYPWPPEWTEHQVNGL